MEMHQCKLSYRTNCKQFTEQIMTAKEKAEQIYDEIYSAMENGVPKKFAIKCAIVVVEKMIEYVRRWADEDYATMHIIYLEQVKNEILKI